MTGFAATPVAADETKTSIAGNDTTINVSSDEQIQVAMQLDSSAPSSSTVTLLVNDSDGATVIDRSDSVSPGSSFIVTRQLPADQYSVDLDVADSQNVSDDVVSSYTAYRPWEYQRQITDLSADEEVVVDMYVNSTDVKLGAILVNSSADPSLINSESNITARTTVSPTNYDLGPDGDQWVTLRLGESLTGNFTLKNGAYNLSDPDYSSSPYTHSEIVEMENATESQESVAVSNTEEPSELPRALITVVAIGLGLLLVRRRTMEE